MNTVLLIDDEEKLRSLLAKIISLENFQVIEAGDSKSGLRKLEQHEIDQYGNRQNVNGETGAANRLQGTLVYNF